VVIRDRVFISYSNLDEKWLTMLRKQLKPLEDKGLNVWSDKNIKPGQEWPNEIIESLARAKVAVLLISVNFLNSNFRETLSLPKDEQSIATLAKFRLPADPLPVDVACEASNAVDSTDLTGAYDHLVNLLANHLGLPNQRNDVLQRLKMSGPIGQEIYQTVERRDNSRDDYWQILQACLEHYDQDSLQVFRQVIATLLGTRTSARQLDQAFVALLDALADNGKANG